MSDDRAKKLAQLKKAYESGILDEDTYQATLVGLGVTPSSQIGIEGSGTTAAGGKAKAAGKQAVIAETVGHNIITGDNLSYRFIATTIFNRQIGDSND